MTSFSKYYEQQTMGIVEPIFIEDVGDLKAKIDSGNDGYNVLDAANIEYRDGKITFLSNQKTITRKVISSADINIGSGVTEQRYVVPFNIKFKGQFYPNTPFTLADRSSNECPVLLGEIFLKQIDAVIQVNSKEALI